MKSILLYLTCLTLLISAFQLKEGVSITFRNNSQENFKEIHVWILNKRFNFKNVNAGESTEVVEIKKIYSTCTVQVITYKDTLSFMPVDHVGETATTNGTKVIKLTILTDTDGKRRLSIE